MTTEDQIVVAAEITTESGDFEQLEPMISAAEQELELRPVPFRIMGGHESAGRKSGFE